MAARSGDRTRSKLVYFTPQEWEEVDAAATAVGETPGAYIRRVALGAKARVRPGDALVKELARIGNNLNQLARAANAGGHPSASLDEALHELLGAIRRL